MKKISNITLTIDDCDYSYDCEKEKFIAYWCDCPIDSNISLIHELVDFSKKINFMIDKGYINLD